MKRISSIILVLFTLSAALNAYNWFDKRYAELEIQTKLGASNNVIGISNLLSKNVVIDFDELAKNASYNGFMMNSNLLTALNLNFDFRKWTLSVKTGFEGSGDLQFSKDLLDFLADGNKNSGSLTCDSSMSGDVFVYQEVDVGWNIKGFNVQIQPAFFLPVFHADSDKTSVTFVNDDKGNIQAVSKSEIGVFSAYNFDEKSLSAGFGFDLGAAASYDLFDFLTLRGKVRIPIVPGKTGYRSNYTMSMTANTSLNDIISGNSVDSSTSKNLEDWTTEDFFINRPMKFNAYADFKPFGNFIVLTGGLGLGFRHPFTSRFENFKTYVEYYLGAQIDFFNILGFVLSTEYTDQIFIHQVGIKANCRILEIDAGINSQSKGFIGSFKGAGIGGYLSLKLGY